ncbi:MAG: glycoside hydrolase family 26 protein [Bacteroidia bacterium]|nr:glycoside hydrolase family 26 protein [Bacteroidia bacterium]
MKINLKITLVALLVALCQFHLQAQNDSTKLVNPKPSDEAKALYAYLLSISGKKTLAGQHCPPLLADTRLSVVHRKTKQYPALFGQDFGFSYPGYWDGINYRQQIVDNAIRRHEQGFIISLMWHAVPPTMDEPVSFEEGIQGSLSPSQWEELLTEGSPLNERWKSQVDVIAWFLKQLKYAKVPVIWRPYHEMNGGWFWWGKKKGEYQELYRMLFDRLVKFHKLNNLIWVYNTNEIKLGVDGHEVYYPGDEYVDIIATDVYRTGYNEANYKQLTQLAQKSNKPIALGEVGIPPSVEILKNQPKWLWFMKWDDPGSDDPKRFGKLYESENVLKLSDLPWTKEKNPRLHYPVLKD